MVVVADMFMLFRADDVCEVGVPTDDCRRSRLVGLDFVSVLEEEEEGLDFDCPSFFLRFSAIQTASISSRESSEDGVAMMHYQYCIVV